MRSCRGSKRRVPLSSTYSSHVGFIRFPGGHLSAVCTAPFLNSSVINRLLFVFDTPALVADTPLSDTVRMNENCLKKNSRKRTTRVRGNWCEYGLNPPFLYIYQKEGYPSLHNLLCDCRVWCEERPRYAASAAQPILGLGMLFANQFLVVQVTSSRYWARVSLFCSTSAAFQRISRTLPEPAERFEQQQLYVDVLVLLGVAILSPP